MLDKPRRIDDDLMFRTKRGKQFHQESLHRAWVPVRAAFMAKLPVGHHLHQRLALDPEDRMDFYELRHFGASDMLNVLGLEAWVVAKQLRHRDGGILVTQLYGHPDCYEAISRMRRAYTASVTRLRGTAPAQLSDVRGNSGERDDWVWLHSGRAARTETFLSVPPVARRSAETGPLRRTATGRAAPAGIEMRTEPCVRVRTEPRT